MEYKVALSFFRILPQDFSFIIYRCRQTSNPQEKPILHPEAKTRKLPLLEWAEVEHLQGEVEYKEFWVQYHEAEEFEPYECGSRTNTYITLDYLFHLLKSRCASLSEEKYNIDERSFNSRISFLLSHHQEGDQVVWLQPYLLKEKGEFGFLADFKFDKAENVPFSRRTLELSLAQKDGRTNKDFYADRFTKLQQFMSLYQSSVFDLRSDPSQITIQKTLSELSAARLDTKTYVFAEGQTSNSQFVGIRDNGPLALANDNVKLYLVHRAEDRGLSHDLFRALRGDTFKTFPGMEAMFGFTLDRNHIESMTIEAFDAAYLDQVCTLMAEDASGRPVVPIVIGPFNRLGDSEANRIYHLSKHAFLKKGWPSQFVGRHTLINRDTLKWSISNIGLALFAKMGGQPWKVQPKSESSLIVGLGQAHRVVHDAVQKYFAYSVLTDSSGLYKEIRVLGSSSCAIDYLAQFKIKLREVFAEYAPNYNRFVIHATFKIGKDELSAVKTVLSSFQSETADGSSPKEFVVMKFNDKNRFFGYSQKSNTLLPYESTFLRISNTEYLVWFEGLQLHNPNIFKQIERPVHVEFLYSSEGIDDQKKTNYLQDAVNISGGNWRGFNAKSLPISVYYAKLIATYSAEFQRLGLEDINLAAISPWFL